MSKVSSLKPFQEPPPPERQACNACRAFAPECLVPIGDAAVPMCWLCAHHVIEHSSSIGAAPTAECECEAHDIYPHRTVAVLEPQPTPAQRRLASFERVGATWTGVHGPEFLVVDERSGALADCIGTPRKGRAS